MRYKYLLIVTALYLNISFSEIVVEISTDKNRYLEAEPIFFTVLYINKSDHTDSLSYEQLGLWNIQTSNSDNKKMFFQGDIPGYLQMKYKKFKPGDTLGVFTNFLNYWRTQRLNTKLLGASGYLSKGNYSIKYLNSNIINLQINEPIADERIVFNKLIRAYQINDGNPWIMDSILHKKDTYYDIVLNHTQSIYWEEAVYRYNEESNWLKLDYTDIYVNKEFVKRFPDSYFMRHILINLCQAIYHYEGGESAVNAYLQYLIENYENYAVSSHAKEQLIKKEYLN